MTRELTARDVAEIVPRTAGLGEGPAGFSANASPPSPMLPEPRTRRLLTLALTLAAALVVAATAGGGIADETALAQKYAPVVRLVDQPVECGPGEPYRPMDVNALFGNPTV